MGKRGGTVLSSGWGGAWLPGFQNQPEQCWNQRSEGLWERTAAPQLGPLPRAAHPGPSRPHPERISKILFVPCVRICLWIYIDNALKVQKGGLLVLPKSSPVRPSANWAWAQDPHPWPAHEIKAVSKWFTKSPRIISTYNVASNAPSQETGAPFVQPLSFFCAYPSPVPKRLLYFPAKCGRETFKCSDHNYAKTGQARARFETVIVKAHYSTRFPPKLKGTPNCFREKK